MMNFATVLKEEVRRLARKEVRAQTTTTKRAAAAHRRDIAQLKRRIKALERRLGLLARQLMMGKPAKPSAGGETDGPANRFSSRSVRAQRRRLKLSAAEYGKLVGVSGQTVYQWEQGKSRPRRSQLASLVTVRSIGRREALARLHEIAKK
jgi:DNA-binding XRE family transcriptional regulator